MVHDEGLGLQRGFFCEWWGQGHNSMHNTVAVMVIDQRGESVQKYAPFTLLEAGSLPLGDISIVLILPGQRKQVLQDFCWVVP